VARGPPSSTSLSDGEIRLVNFSVQHLFKSYELAVFSTRKPAIPPSADASQYQNQVRYGRMKLQSLILLSGMKILRN